MTSTDRIIVEILYEFTVENAIARILVIFFGEISGYLIALAFLAWIIFIWRKTSNAAFALQVAFAAISSRIALEIIRFALNVERPFIALNIPPLFAPIDIGPALPSGHATLFFGLAAVTWGQSKKISVALFSAATLMGIGRVAAGVHWPTDILAGAALGIAAGYFAKRVISS
jgi:membrane-associated phospholipid phosphatase